jgi:hypothetical protein
MGVDKPKSGGSRAGNVAKVMPMKSMLWIGVRIENGSSVATGSKDRIIKVGKL